MPVTVYEKVSFNEKQEFRMRVYFDTDSVEFGTDTMFSKRICVDPSMMNNL